MSRKGGLRAGVNNPKTRRGKMAFFDEGGNTSNIDPTKLEDEAKARSDKWFPLERNAVTGKAKLGTSMGEALKASSPGPKTRGEAFKLARFNHEKQFEWPPGSGKMYHTRTAEEEAARKPAAPRTAAPKAEAPKAEAPRAAAPKAESPKAPTKANATRVTATAAAAATNAARTSPDAATRMRQARQDWRASKDKSESEPFQKKKVVGADVPNVPYSPSTFERSINDDATVRAITGSPDVSGRPATRPGDYSRPSATPDPRTQRVLGSGPRVSNLGLDKDKTPPYKIAFAKGGSVDKAMEKRHASWMASHGAPKKMVAEEKKEAAGMKCGGKVMKYAKGGGIESKGKTQGKMVKMASGGSVSARADGIASRGKTNCKYR